MSILILHLSDWLKIASLIAHHILPVMIQAAI